MRCDSRHNGSEMLIFRLQQNCDVIQIVPGTECVYLATKMRCDSSCDRRCDSHRGWNELVRTLSCIIHMATDNSWTLYKCVGLATYVCIQLSDVMFCEKWVTDRHCGNGGRGVPFFFNCQLKLFFRDSGPPGLHWHCRKDVFFLFISAGNYEETLEGAGSESQTAFFFLFFLHILWYESVGLLCVFSKVFFKHGVEFGHSFVSVKSIAVLSTCAWFLGMNYFGLYVVLQFV